MADDTRVSACIIAFNEAAGIRRTLESVAWCDEVVVVDSGSTDGTTALCGEFGARVLHRDWTGFVDQKNFAQDAASHPWVFSLDADEVCTPELATEARAVLGDGKAAPAYRVPRRVFFMGRWIRYTDWSPDYQLRFYRRDAGRWRGGRVHESVGVEGPVGRLSGHLLHYTYDDLGDYIRKLESYSLLSARDMLDHGRRATRAKLLCSPVAAFVKSYVFKRGFLDGFPGMVIAGLSAASVFFRYARLLELARGQAPSDRKGPGGTTGQPEKEPRMNMDGHG